MAQDDIQGQVVDAQGNPVDGAIVELTKSYQSSPDSRGNVFRTTTDSNGNYIFTGHQEGDGTTQEWHVSCYTHDGTAYVNSFNNPGVTADLPSNAIPDSDLNQYRMEEGSGTTLEDSRGSVPATLSGGGWTTSARSFFDHATTYDGTDDYWVTDSPTDLNNTTYSAWCWINRSGDGTVSGYVFATNNSTTSNYSDGWDVVVRDDPNDVDPGKLFLAHSSGGTRAAVVESPTGLITSGEDFFIGVAGNGDSGSVYVWDENGQIYSESGSAPRATTTETNVIGMANNSQYVSGSVSAVGLANQEYSEQDFAEIYSATV